MGKKDASGRKKARWTRAQKLEAKRSKVRREDSDRPSRSSGSYADRGPAVRKPRRDERRFEQRSSEFRGSDRRDQRRDGWRDDRGERGDRRYDDRRQGRRDDGGERSGDRRYDRGERSGSRGYDRGERSGERRYDGGERSHGSRRFGSDDRPGGNKRFATGGRRFEDGGRSANGGRFKSDRPAGQDRDRYRREDRDGREGRGYRQDGSGYRQDDRGYRQDDRGDRSYSRENRDRRGGFDSRQDRPARRYDRDDRRDNRRDGGYRNDRREDYRTDRSGGSRDHRSNWSGDEHARLHTDGEEQLEHTNAAYGWVEREEIDETSVEPIDVSDNGFADLGVPEVLVQRLARDGITAPFPIQTATIPDAMQGRDVLGRGRTGSGKTLSYGLPMLTRLAKGGKARPGQPRSVVLVPTRELAMQVSDALQPLVHVLGLRHKLVAGGMPYEPQLQALERGVDVLIATPGRLIDLMDRGAADLSRVEIVVLDEADHMAQIGFLEAIERILQDVPEGQRLLFSATLDRGVDQIVEQYLTDPVEHATDDSTAAVTTMDHHALLIEPRDKKTVTAEVANRAGRTVVFVRTKLGGDRVARELRDQGVLAAALHGGLNQAQRNRVLAAFRDGRIPVLVATDVAARGIHVDDVGVVLQIDPPADHKDYLHRAGRTARAGEKGTVVTLALPHQRRTVQRLLDQAGVGVTLTKAAPGDDVIRATGGSTPDAEPISEDDLQRILKPAQGRRGRGQGGRGYAGGGGRGYAGGRGQSGRGGRGGGRSQGGRGGYGGYGERQDGGRGSRRDGDRSRGGYQGHRDGDRSRGGHQAGRDRREG